MEEQLEKLRSNRLLEVYNLSMLSSSPGKSGMILTTDRKLYTYHKFAQLDSTLKKRGIPLEDITMEKELGEEEYQEVIRFITDKIVGKELKSVPLRDSLYAVYCDYEGKSYASVNEIDRDGEEKGLYFLTQDLFKKFLH